MPEYVLFDPSTLNACVNPLMHVLFGVRASQTFVETHHHKNHHQEDHQGHIVMSYHYQDSHRLIVIVILRFILTNINLTLSQMIQMI
jgi:hypothetical protein